MWTYNEILLQFAMFCFSMGGVTLFWLFLFILIRAHSDYQISVEEMPDEDIS